MNLDTMEEKTMTSPVIDKNLKITRNIVQNVNSTATISSQINFDLSDPEEVHVQRKDGEGTSPIFSHPDIKVNQYKNEISNESSSKPSSSKRIRNVSESSSEHEFRNSKRRKSKETIYKKFSNLLRRSREPEKFSSDDEDTFQLIQETMGANFKLFDDKKSKKRPRRNSSSSSGSSIDLEPKRNDHKYGHSSKLEDEKLTSTKYATPGKNDRKKSYLSDSSSYREYKKWKSEKYDRKHKSNGRKYQGNKNYPHKTLSANDIEERYYRYYAVMVAFTIIMDILRQDGIYSF